MTLADFERYATIATLLVIPSLGIIADAFHALCERYVAHAAETPEKADDARAARLLRAANAFLSATAWLGENVGRVIPLVRRFVVQTKRAEKA